MIDFFLECTQFVDRAVAGGYVIALALVCLIQYVWHVFVMSRQRKLSVRFRDEMERMSAELQQAQTDRTLSHLENRMLRDFGAQAGFEKAIRVLFRSFVPEVQSGFCALLEFQAADSEAIIVNHARGLSDESRGNVWVDAELRQSVFRDGAVILESRQLRGSRLFKSLAFADQDKIRALFLVAVGDADEPVGILISTSLYPTEANREQQIRLVRHFMLSVARNLKRKQTFDRQNDELRSTAEMLELRSIADRQFQTPLQMLHAFLNCLLEKIGADRASLYLTTQNTTSFQKVLLRCGRTLDDHIQLRWQQHEDRLAGTDSGQSEIQVLDAARLQRIGINTLIGSAMIAPLTEDTRSIGIISFTREERSKFSEAERQLVVWSAEYLADTIRRVLSHAVSQKRAREDALTELANRREFDKRIRVELDAAERNGTNCTLLLFDFDRFKSVNDTYGHQAGDEVLRVTSRILREEVRRVRGGDRALVARYGGEEIAVLLPATGTAAANRISESLRAAIEAQTISFQQHEIRVTVSVGVAVFPQHSRSAGDLVAAADAALYQAKESGRNTVSCALESLV